MKSLLVASAHGGTGRTTVVCQFAHYLRLVCGYRVLVVDLAEPARSAISLTRGASARLMKCGALNVRSDRLPNSAGSCIGVLAADALRVLRTETIRSVRVATPTCDIYCPKSRRCLTYV